MKFKILLLFMLFVWSCQTSPPSKLANVYWEAQNSGISASLRGISAVNEKVAWVSGSGGYYARTTDGGTTWEAHIVPGADSLDFRDVQAFDENLAYLLSAGSGERSRIYKTLDGGKNWELQFTNSYPKGFFDGMAFWDSDNGIAYSDPVDGHPLIITTTDGGANWNRVPPENIPPEFPEEYGFAASGTGITVQGKENVWICSGGEAARVFRSMDKGQTWTVAATPIISGNQSSGIFSLVFRDTKNGVAVGGDYNKPKQANNNVAVTNDGGQTWTLIKDPQSVEFRSCVRYIPNTPAPMLVSVGPSGSDYSIDGGMTWVNIDTVGYHTMSFGVSIDAGWAAGADGRVAKFSASVVK